jgi:chromosome segregation ATPase
MWRRLWLVMLFAGFSWQAPAQTGKPLIIYESELKELVSGLESLQQDLAISREKLQGALIELTELRNSLTRSEAILIEARRRSTVLSISFDEYKIEAETTIARLQRRSNVGVAASVALGVALIGALIASAL